MTASSDLSSKRADFAWGLNGLLHLRPNSDVVVIVDVLSFSTAVDVAVSQGAQVLPFALGREGAAAYAERQGAMLAQPRSAAGGQFSLSPRSLARLQPGQRIVLPSPNGSMLSGQTGTCVTLAGCLRNAAAVAEAAQQSGARIAVIAAGEKWPDGSLRPALEDLLGAGAILEQLCVPLSPDAEAARASYRGLKSNLDKAIHDCGSGQELIQAGFAEDVAYALAENTSRALPELREGAYRDSSCRTSEAG